MFKKVATPVFGIVEDMTYFLCLPLRGRSEIFSHHGARQKAERLGTELHGEVLLDLKARETSDGRSPITVSEPDNPQVLVFRHIAGRICEKVSAHAEQRATRIVVHYTGIKRAQPKLPVSRKASGKPTMNGDP
jgi:ATP-binding protein involved in chromosome partitioning